MATAPLPRTLRHESEASVLCREEYDRLVVALKPILIQQFAPWLNNDASLCRDIVHDKLMDLTDQLHTYDPAKGKPVTWITNAVKYAVMRASVLQQREVPFEELDGDISTDRNHEASVEKAIDIRRAVEALPATLSYICILTMYEGYTYKEIGGMIGVTKQRVGQWMQQALNILRVSLASYKGGRR